jgi:hypothetical protein
MLKEASQVKSVINIEKDRQPSFIAEDFGDVETCPCKPVDGAYGR